MRFSPAAREMFDRESVDIAWKHKQCAYDLLDERKYDEAETHFDLYLYFVPTQGCA